MRKPTSAEALLAMKGLVPGTDGHGVAALRDLAIARGWRVDVEATPGPDGAGRFRAAVWRPAPARGGRPGVTVVRRAAATEAGALAQAVAAALAREPV